MFISNDHVLKVAQSLLLLRHLQHGCLAGHRRPLRRRLLRVSRQRRRVRAGDGAGPRLPEIVVLAQEHTSQLMHKAFDVAIATNVSSASYVSGAMALLNVQTGV